MPGWNLKSFPELKRPKNEVFYYDNGPFYVKVDFIHADSSGMVYVSYVKNHGSVISKYVYNQKELDDVLTVIREAIYVPKRKEE